MTEVIKQNFERLVKKVENLKDRLQESDTKTAQRMTGICLELEDLYLKVEEALNTKPKATPTKKAPAKRVAKKVVKEEVIKEDEVKSSQQF